jgi:hypothetical protein
MQIENKFIHHVFFYLKNSGNKEDKAALVAGLKKMTKIPAFRMWHIGEAADTNREVIERGYAVSWFVLFDNGADQASYQDDPIHKVFVKECSHLWSKVVVYDSVDAK